MRYNWWYWNLMGQFIKQECEISATAYLKTVAKRAGGWYATLKTLVPVLINTRILNAYQSVC